MTFKIRAPVLPPLRFIALWTVKWHRKHMSQFYSRTCYKKGCTPLFMVPELTICWKPRHHSCFRTTTSKMPSDLKFGANSLGSTGPGRLKESVNGPGGHNCWNSISKTRDRFFIVLPPAVDPRRWTMPLDSISQLNGPATTNDINLRKFRKEHTTLEE